MNENNVPDRSSISESVYDYTLKYESSKILREIQVL